MGSDESLGQCTLIDSAVFTSHGVQVNMAGIIASTSKIETPDSILLLEFLNLCRVFVVSRLNTRAHSDPLLWFSNAYEETHPKQVKTATKVSKKTILVGV